MSGVFRRVGLVELGPPEALAVARWASWNSAHPTLVSEGRMSPELETLDPLLGGDGAEIPRWRWKEVLAGATEGGDQTPCRLAIPKVGAGRIG